MSAVDALRARIARARIVMSDRFYPGGLASHVNPGTAAARPADVEPARPAGAAVITDLATRTVPVESYFGRPGPLGADLAATFTTADEEALDAVITDHEREILSRNVESDRTFLAIAMALNHGLPGVAERTGLRASMPPGDVHAMSHESWSTGGDPWYANLIDLAFADAGVDLTQGATVLDYGCSSGRIVRMLAARRPGSSWHGCDVNEAAIMWASAQLPDVAFEVQPLRPPLSYAEGAFDAAYAISIWSHYAAEPALTWLDEMHRVIKPGGALLLTTHGVTAIAERAKAPEHGPQAQVAILESLYRDGFVFVDIFGADGDWGVVDSGWGMSFLTPEWLLAQVTPKWSVKLYRSGGIQGHQDLYVLEREH